MSELSDVARAVIAKIECGEIKVDWRDGLSRAEYGSSYINPDGVVMVLVSAENGIDWRAPVPMSCRDREAIADALERRRTWLRGELAGQHREAATRAARRLFLGEE